MWSQHNGQDKNNMYSTLSLFPTDLLPISSIFILTPLVQSRSLTKKPAKQISFWGDDMPCSLLTNRVATSKNIDYNGQLISGGGLRQMHT